MDVEAAKRLRSQLVGVATQADVIALLERFDVPDLNDDLRARARRCRATPFVLLTLTSGAEQRSRHDVVSRERSLCVCLMLDTLVLKSISVFMARSHGHHLRETVMASHEVIDKAEFAALAVPPPPA